MSIPSILFGLVVAFLLGALFHAVRGGNGWRLLLSLFLGALGFMLGQFAGMWFGITLYPFGILDLGAGVLGSLIILILGDWLSRIKPANKSSV